MKAKISSRLRKVLRDPTSRYELATKLPDIGVVKEGQKVSVKSAEVIVDTEAVKIQKK